MHETLNEPIPRPMPELEEDLNVATTWFNFQATKPERDFVYRMWCQANGMDPEDPSAAYLHEVEWVKFLPPHVAVRWRREGYVP